MLKEIYEQPKLIKNLFAHYNTEQGKKGLQAFKDQGPFEKIHLCACGTAYFAGLVMRDYFEKFNKIQTSVEFASEFRYRQPILKKVSLVW